MSTIVNILEMSRSNSIRGSSSRRTMPRKLCASLVISVERRNGCLINRSRLSTRMVPNRWKGGGIEARAIVRGGGGMGALPIDGS